MFEQVEAGPGEKVGDCAQVVDAPLAAKARRAAKDRTTGLAGLRVDHVIGVVNPAAAKLIKATTTKIDNRMNFHLI